LECFEKVLELDPDYEDALKTKKNYFITDKGLIWE